MMNVERFTQTAAAEAGMSAESLLKQIAGDPRELELFAQVAEVASRSLDGWKVDLLARIFVHGTQDEDKVDGAVLAFDAVRQLERPHLRLLKILASENPNSRDGRWSEKSVVAADPGLTEGYDALISKLGSVGMVIDTDVDAVMGYSGGSWKLTSLGRRCAGYLAKRGTALGEG
ncbi:hypothetical protein O7632_09950 [Solwaraspora sp. WMMD406]|uniref:hypothetical protein n=1 Tax=Solwaraspora sp. WMMD406 TaxID=3016095 RepID=UPI0024169455|nr:hypothetical protein [Solwaraspora sp. WMMD406]MDG4764423.1 hypothetical protein [Solwaraspora sp. WMMD406]